MRVRQHFLIHLPQVYNDTHPLSTPSLNSVWANGTERWQHLALSLAATSTQSHYAAWTRQYARRFTQYRIRTSHESGKIGQLERRVGECGHRCADGLDGDDSMNTSEIVSFWPRYLFVWPRCRAQREETHEKSLYHRMYCCRQLCFVDWYTADTTRAYISPSSAFRTFPVVAKRSRPN